MSDKQKGTEKCKDSRTMRDHPQGSLTVPENKLAGGEPVFELEPDLNSATPDLKVPAGQTTHQ